MFVWWADLRDFLCGVDVVWMCAPLCRLIWRTDHDQVLDIGMLRTMRLLFYVPLLCTTQQSNEDTCLGKRPEANNLAELLVYIGYQSSLIQIPIISRPYLIPSSSKCYHRCGRHSHWPDLRMNNSDTPASETISAKDPAVQKANLEGRIEQVNSASPRYNFSKTESYPTDLPIHQSQKVLCRIHCRAHRIASGQAQKAQQTVQRLPALLTKPGWLGARDLAKGRRSCREW